MEFPEMATVRQDVFRSTVDDPLKAIRACFATLPDRLSGNGKTVAVCVGSRRIDRLDLVVDACLRFLERRGFRPFIVPAMGSHGGATAQGQKTVLERYGITEARMKVPIAADMDVEMHSRHPSGCRIFVAKAALKADHLVVINRVKPHTKFKADIESGLCKMMTIGLGKDAGAAEFHRFAVAHSFKIIEESAAILLNSLPLLFGVAVLEDGFGRLSHVEAIFPEHLIFREKLLLKEAFRMLGRIPFEALDILIVDRFGKDISGIGMDSNVTGRHRDLVGDIRMAPHVKRIFVRDLSPASDGNGNGIGLADVTTSRLVRGLDLEKTYVNSLTAISPEKAAIPMHFEADRDCLVACARTTGVGQWKDLRMVRIRSTADLTLLQASKPLEPEIQASPILSRISPWQALAFDPEGNLTEFHPHDRP